MDRRTKRPIGYYEILRIGKSYNRIFDEVLPFFGDGETTRLWMTMDNPLLGGLKPIEMICNGKEKRLLKIIKDTIYENKPKKD